MSELGKNLTWYFVNIYSARNNIQIHPHLRKLQTARIQCIVTHVYRHVISYIDLLWCINLYGRLIYFTTRFTLQVTCHFRPPYPSRLYRAMPSSWSRLIARSWWRSPRPSTSISPLSWSQMTLKVCMVFWNLCGRWSWGVGGIVKEIRHWKPRVGIKTALCFQWSWRKWIPYDISFMQRNHRSA